MELFSDVAVRLGEGVLDYVFSSATTSSSSPSSCGGAEAEATKEKTKKKKNVAALPVDSTHADSSSPSSSNNAAVPATISTDDEWSAGSILLSTTDEEDGSAAAAAAAAATAEEGRRRVDDKESRRRGDAIPPFVARDSADLDQSGSDLDLDLDEARGTEDDVTAEQSASASASASADLLAAVLPRNDAALSPRIDTRAEDGFHCSATSSAMAELWAVHEDLEYGGAGFEEDDDDDDGGEGKDGVSPVSRIRQSRQYDQGPHSSHDGAEDGEGNRCEEPNNEHLPNNGLRDVHVHVDEDVDENSCKYHSREKHAEPNVFVDLKSASKADDGTNRSDAVDEHGFLVGKMGAAGASVGTPLAALRDIQNVLLNEQERPHHITYAPGEGNGGCDERNATSRHSLELELKRSRRKVERASKQQKRGGQRHPTAVQKREERLRRPEEEDKENGEGMQPREREEEHACTSKQNGRITATATAANNSDEIMNFRADMEDELRRFQDVLARSQARIEELEHRAREKERVAAEERTKQNQKFLILEEEVTRLNETLVGTAVVARVDVDVGVGVGATDAAEETRRALTPELTPMAEAAEEEAPGQPSQLREAEAEGRQFPRTMSGGDVNPVLARELDFLLGGADTQHYGRGKDGNVGEGEDIFAHRSIFSLSTRAPPTREEQEQSQSQSRQSSRSPPTLTSTSTGCQILPGSFDPIGLGNDPQEDEANLDFLLGGAKIDRRSNMNENEHGDIFAHRSIFSLPQAPPTREDQSQSQSQSRQSPQEGSGCGILPGGRWGDSNGREGPSASFRRGVAEEGKPIGQSRSRSRSRAEEKKQSTVPVPLLDDDEQSRTHYGTLGLNPSATAGEIKGAYRRLALRFHPDKQLKKGGDGGNGGGGSGGAEGQHSSTSSIGSSSSSGSGTGMFHRISEAYEVLRDEARRRHYDARMKCYTCTAGG